MTKEKTELESYKKKCEEFYKKMSDDQIKTYKKELKLARSNRKRELHNKRLIMVNDIYHYLLNN